MPAVQHWGRKESIIWPPRGYIYSSMAFAGIVELFNVLARRNRVRNAARTKRQGMRERHQ